MTKEASPSNPLLPRVQWPLADRDRRAASFDQGDLSRPSPRATFRSQRLQLRSLSLPGLVGECNLELSCFSLFNDAVIEACEIVRCAQRHERYAHGSVVCNEQRPSNLRRIKRAFFICMQPACVLQAILHRILPIYCADGLERPRGEGVSERPSSLLTLALYPWLTQIRIL